MRPVAAGLSARKVPHTFSADYFWYSAMRHRLKTQCKKPFAAFAARRTREGLLSCRPKGGFLRNAKLLN